MGPQISKTDFFPKDFHIFSHYIKYISEGISPLAPNDLLHTDACQLTVSFAFAFINETLTIEFICLVCLIL